MTSSIVWLPEFLIKSSLILLLAATINALLRGKSADLRHRVWFAAITATAAIGAFALFPRALPATITFQVATSAVPLAIRPTSSWLATLRY